MTPSLESTFLSFSARKLSQLESRIEDCLGRLTAEQVWYRNAEAQNAIGNLVLHLCGNVRQWIISGVSGKSDTRDRDSEFAARSGAPPHELAGILGAVVREAVAVLNALPPDRLAQRLVIQQYDVTALEAIYTSVEHFGQHTGQIIFATKLLTSSDLGYYAHLSRHSHGQQTP